MVIEYYIKILSNTDRKKVRDIPFCALQLCVQFDLQFRQILSFTLDSQQLPNMKFPKITTAINFRRKIISAPSNNLSKRASSDSFSTASPKTRQ